MARKSSAADLARARKMFADTTGDWKAREADLRSWHARAKQAGVAVRKCLSTCPANLKTMKSDISALEKALTRADAAEKDLAKARKSGDKASLKKLEAKLADLDAKADALSVKISGLFGTHLGVITNAGIQTNGLDLDT